MAKEQHIQQKHKLEKHKKNVWEQRNPNTELLSVLCGNIHISDIIFSQPAGGLVDISVMVCLLLHY